MKTGLVALLVSGISLTFAASTPEYMPSITFQTYIYGMPQQATQISTRSIVPETKRTHLRRRPITPSADQDNRSQVVRTEDGVLKIIFGQPPLRDSPDIVFPGPTSKPKPKPGTENNSLQLMPDPCGNGQNFCEEVAGYDERIDELLKNSVVSIDKFISVDEMDPGPIEIGQRNDFSKVVSMCSSTERVIYPQAGKTKENKWLYILNKEQYRQGVRVEICDNPDSKCQFADRLPLGYEATCKQKYIYRTLLAINNETGEQSTEQFSTPSCCQCSIKVSGVGIATRIGLFDQRSSARSNGTTAK